MTRVKLQLGIPRVDHAKSSMRLEHSADSVFREEELSLAVRDQ